MHVCTYRFVVNRPFVTNSGSIFLTKRLIVDRLIALNLDQQNHKPMTPFDFLFLVRIINKMDTYKLEDKTKIFNMMYHG